ncbi:unnamed protein product, partial [Ilex paraguariensis]
QYTFVIHSLFSIPVILRRGFDLLRPSSNDVSICSDYLSMMAQYAPAIFWRDFDLVRPSSGDVLT